MAFFRRLFIDFDSFYASVEQQDNSEYRGKPVIVVPVVSDYTCAIAASYQAKRLGVKTGTRVKTAKEKIPGLFVCGARPKRYVEVHNQIVEILSQHFKKIQVLSIDEMACEIDEEDDFDCEMIAALLKLDFQERLGEYITCSIGVAKNVFLSKVAADMDKPNGFTALGQKAQEQLKTLGLTDLPGIAEKMEARLNKSRIRTVEDLFNTEELKLKKAWGSIIGARWYHMIRGSLQCDYGLSDNEIPKSFGHTHVLPPAKRDDAGSFEVFEALLFKGLERLNKHRIGAKRVSIYLSWRNTETKRRGTYKKSSPIAIASMDYTYWSMIANELWKQIPPLDLKAIPLLVGIRFTRTMKQEDINLQLFDLDFFPQYEVKEMYEVPDRISFGDPGRLFDEDVQLY
jgi:DNA polymerase-4